MSEEEIGTIEDYVKITTSSVTVSSGITFKVRAMGAAATVGLMAKIPEDGIPDDGMAPFIIDNIDFIVNTIIASCVIEPKIPKDRIRFADVMELLNEIMSLSGFGSEGEDDVESFLGENNDDST